MIIQQEQEHQEEHFYDVKVFFVAQSVAFYLLIAISTEK